MAKQEHLAILNQGVEMWNQWRKEHTDMQPDLSRTTFIGADFGKADLSFVNLSEANLYQTNFTKANLTKANLHEASFYQANLHEANLRGCVQRLEKPDERGQGR